MKYLFLITVLLLIFNCSNQPTQVDEIESFTSPDTVCDTSYYIDYNVSNNISGRFAANVFQVVTGGMTVGDSLCDTLCDTMYAPGRDQVRDIKYYEPEVLPLKILSYNIPEDTVRNILEADTFCSEGISKIVYDTTITIDPVIMWDSLNVKIEKATHRNLYQYIIRAYQFCPDIICSTIVK